MENQVREARENRLTEYCPGPCRFIRQVKEFGRLTRRTFRTFRDPCRFIRQVKKFVVLEFPEGLFGLAAKLLHLPDKPAGVAETSKMFGLAAKLLHLPDKPAGVTTRLLEN